MNKHLRHANTFGRPLRGESAHVAEAVRSDFSALFAIFDRQLANGAGTNGRMRSHTAEARSAAKRGMELSNQLVRVLRQGSGA
jgi:hypothetical protein